MKITKIGFGFTKNLGHYENQKLYLEAELEEWEDASQSLNILRDRVAEELSLPDKYLDLKGKFARQLRASEEAKTKLEEINEKIEQAMAAWENFAEFLVGHGVEEPLQNLSPRVTARRDPGCSSPLIGQPCRKHAPPPLDRKWSDLEGR